MKEDKLFHLREYAKSAISNNIAKRITHEARENLKSRQRFGESKHDAKAEARRLGISLNGSFSHDTDSEYSKKAGYIISRIISEHPNEISHLNDCKPYVKEFMERCYDWVAQADTVHTYVYAVMAALNINDYHELGFDKLTKRSSHRSRRCRTESNSDKKLKGAKYKMVRAFCLCTGARRGGALGVCTDDLYFDADGNYFVQLTEKGGKTRLAIVSPEYVEFIMWLFENPQGNTVNGKTYLFSVDAVAKNLSLHIQRDRYAAKLYMRLLAEGKYNTNELYRCRKERKGHVFDAGAALQTSVYLGHSRVNVAVCRYLFEVRMTEDELDGFKEGK